MSQVIYLADQLTMTIERQDDCEAKVTINGVNLIWISREQEEDFVYDIKALLNKYRI